MDFQYALISEKGPRPRNEDTAEVVTLSNGALVACVADGVGGQSGGDVASKEAVQLFLAALKEDANEDLSAILRKAHNKIRLIGEQKPEYFGLATTFSGCVIDKGRLRGVHTGDSRIYILRGNGIKQITSDQTEVARFIDEGKLPKNDARIYPRRNVLESALGTFRELKIQQLEFKLELGDRILLTSDGVHGLVSKRDLRDLSLKFPVAQDFVDHVVTLVSESSPTDNFTLVNIVISDLKGIGIEESINRIATH